MTTPPVALTVALARVMPSGPPEHAALAAGTPVVNGAGGLRAAPAVVRAQSTVPSASCLVIPAGSPTIALNAAGAKVPVSLVSSSVSQQPRVVPAPVEALVGKIAPATPVQQLPKPSSGGARLPTPHPVASKAPQTMTIQLPANFQIPQGTVLVRSNTGQLMLVSQQALAQAQSQSRNNASVRQSLPTNMPAVKMQTVQNSGTQVLKVLAAPVKTVCRTTPSVTSTVKKTAIIQSITSGNSRTTTTTAKSLITGPSTKPPASGSSVLSLAPKPVPDIEGTTVAQASSSSEMLENAKKCKNFLATLIKLASSGSQAPEMRQNVKNLEAKMEPEEFTKKLYIELKSSPQPYLVPFLKKSMFALRQLMPNTQAFIQQCLQQSVPQTASPTCIAELSTSSVIAASTPVTTASLQPAKSVLRIPVGIPSQQTSAPVPCTSGVTRASDSVQLVQSAHALSGSLSLQVASPVPSTELATGKNTLKAVHPTSTTVMLTTGTSSLQVVKPVFTPAMSSVAFAALSSVKSVSSAAVTTSLQAVKPTLTTAVAAATTAVTSSLHPITPVAGTPITIRVAHSNSVLSQSVRTSRAVKVKQLIVQHPSGSILKKMTTLQQASAFPVVNKSDEKTPLNALIQASHLPAGSIVKQITLPGNKILSLQASPVQRNKIRDNGTTSFRDEDDINDVTSMAGVNLNEESACILATNSEAVGTVIRSCPEELLISSDALQKKILEIGKSHDIMEVNSDVLNLISHATQEKLKGLLEKLTVIAQHRMMTYKGSEKYTISSDTRAQLRFLEQLDHAEKQKKDEKKREMLLRAAKSRSNKEDPEQLRLKQKAKEMQQLELAQMQQMEANRAALAAIGPRKKRPLDSSTLASVLEGLNRSPNLAKPCLRPRVTRICLRDMIFCMEQEREMKHSLAFYQALMK
ncbi:transcription initiation factor TFIID subunit 4B isoform X2 [Rhineura floridana]|uniref:transcription initiation factor TFIID subunit 4B isoform X2 n=1 Tax=Rhineura floridana TaxID=261503 RepID=UPI002AC849B7|nr:transcription initiation factor TFIID subunit 4B isoform X2 [Rhineura floridana]